ncbi:MAG: antitoxin component YwqK of YwqJK toxin-antitoxin module [Saprospiraceae bacterium]|jgi:antitoxin component YwqK of YwqJK toxin-antitoxin module
MSRIILLFFVIFLIGCSDTETIKVKNDAGVVIEVYTRNKKDFSKEGIYKAFDEEGRLTEEASYKNDTLNGLRKIFFENGNVEAEEIYADGIFDGIYRAYYQDGKLELEGNYVNNEMVGVCKRFYPTGQLMEEVMFSASDENGPFVEYYENGKLKAEGNYKDGDNEDGELKLYDKMGALERKMNCTVGRCITTWRSEALIEKEAQESELD